MNNDQKEINLILLTFILHNYASPRVRFRFVRLTVILNVAE